MIEIDRRAAVLGMLAVASGGADAAPRPLFSTPSAPLIGTCSGNKQFYDLTLFDGFARATGIKPDIFLSFASLDDSWHGGAMQAVFDRGATVMLTLSQRTPDVVARTARGEFDAQLSAVARASRRDQTIVRPFHEMNGQFHEAWSTPPPEDFLAAWRHMRMLWRHADNHAPFCWSPNIVLTKNNTMPFEPYYPGPDQCDLLALDGYRSRYFDLPFADLFAPSLGALMRLGPQPILIAEVGSYAPGEDSHWIFGMFDYLASMPFGKRLVGLNWWQRDQSAIADPATGAAFAAGARRWRAAWAR